MKIERISYQEVEEDKGKSSLDVFLDDKEGKDDKGKEEKNEEKEELEEKPEEKEEKEEKKEGEEEEENIELARVDYEELKKEFPELFKKFPSLKHAFFREQQFTELFPTVEDAKAASEAQAQLEEISETVVSGDVGAFFTSLKNESEDGYKKFTGNFLPTLAKADKDLYLDVISPEVSLSLIHISEPTRPY